MASTENQQHSFPAAPPSLSAGDHEMRDYYAEQNASRPPVNQAPYLTPYLGLRARLSQIWINRWTVLLFLVLARVLIAIATLNDNLTSARIQAMSACSKVENAGSALASMPHYMSQGVNELTAKGVEKDVNGLMSMLGMSVTVVEELVVFYINMLTRTYICLITFAVTGSLHAAIALTEDVTKFLNSTIPAVGDDIAKSVTGFQNDLNNFLKTLKGLPLVGNSVPTLNVDADVNKLHNLQLPSGLTDDLNKLNQSIPTFSDVNNLTQTALRFPFEKVKGLINDSLNTFEFNRTLFPVPKKEQLTFCSDSNGINDFFDDLVTLIFTARKIFIAVIVIAAIAACVPMAYREIRRWRIMQQRSQLVGSNAYEPLDVVYIVSCPYSSKFGISVANRFKSVRNQTIVRWAVAYATSTPALFVLSLSVAGLFSCLCQYFLLKAIQKEVPALTNQVGAFADKVVFALNNASQQWAIGTNQAINNTSNDINKDVFGWVNISTTAINDTLNVFVNEMTTVLNKTFGGTILYDPITEVLNCLIGLKIQSVQKGLTWVQDHAHIGFPLLPNDTFSLGAAASLTNDSSADSFLAGPNSKTKDEISDAVVSLTDKLINALRAETIISACILGAWFIIVLIGIGRALLVFFGHAKTRAEGGRAYTTDPVTDNFRGRDRPESIAPPYEEAPPINRAAPYTLVPRPFPRPPTVVGQQGDLRDEKVGSVGAPVEQAVIRPQHLRASSHGHLGEPSPIDEKIDPFANYTR